MSCEDIKPIIPSYINHTAKDAEISKVEEHLCVCNQCREYLSQLMDKPHSQYEHVETLPEIPVQKDSDVIAYIMLGLGVIVLFFVLFLLIKR